MIFFVKARVLPERYRVLDNLNGRKTNAEPLKRNLYQCL